MPLIECLDCTGKVSDKAPACPHCGCPASALKANLKQQVQTSGTAKYPPSDPVADALKENLKQPKSSSRENEKHLEDDRDWVFPRKARIFVMRLAAVCIFLFPPERTSVFPSDGVDFTFFANLGGDKHSKILDLSTFCFELLALLLLAIFAYKNNTRALKNELKTFGLLYLSAFVILFPPTHIGTFRGYQFIGNVLNTHWIIWVAEIIAVGIAFILLHKHKEK